VLEGKLIWWKQYTVRKLRKIWSRSKVAQKPALCKATASVVWHSQVIPTEFTIFLGRLHKCKHHHKCVEMVHFPNPASYAIRALYLPHFPTQLIFHSTGGNRYTISGTNYFSWRHSILYCHPVNLPKCEHKYEFMILEFQDLHSSNFFGDNEAKESKNFLSPTHMKLICKTRKTFSHDLY
jgi:hypothetical protein